MERKCNETSRIWATHKRPAHAWTGLAMALAEKSLGYVEETPTEAETEYQRPNGLHEELDSPHPFDPLALLAWSIGNLPAHERLNRLVGDKLVVALDYLHHPGAYHRRDEECPRWDQYHRPAHIHEGGRYRPYHRDGATDCHDCPKLVQAPCFVSENRLHFLHISFDQQVDTYLEEIAQEQ